MGDRIIPSGHLVLTWYDKSGKIIKQKELHNQITNAGLDLAFNRGLGSLLKAGADVFGQVYTYDSLMGDYRGAQYHTLESAIHVGLLNLGNNQNGLNIASSIANFYSENFDLLDNVIGYAGINLTPPSNGKEGQLGLSRGSLVPASWTRGMRWVFPVNVAGGTFDTLVLTGRGILTTPYPVSNGEISSICIDKVNTKDANFVSLSTAYCPPGVTGVTGNNEILLNFNDGANSQWKFNMDTGEVTAVAAGTPFFCPITSNIDDWFIEGNYLYTVELRNASSGTTQVNVWDITTQSEVDTFNLSGSSYTYGRHYKFLKYNDEVYVTVNSIDTSSSATRRCWTLNKAGSGQYTSATNGTSIQATIGVTLPTGLPLTQVALGNFGSNYLVYIGDAAMIVSSLENIQGTLLGVIPFVFPRMCGYTGNNSPGFLSIGAPGAAADISGDRITNNNIGAHWFVGNSAKDEVSLYLKGICWTPNGHWGTMTSYYKLSSPESKSDDNILTVDWYYDFSGGTSESGTVT